MKKRIALTLFIVLLVILSTVAQKNVTTRAEGVMEKEFKNHLLDGDAASNVCSWQWVAGTFSSKKYFCNQEILIDTHIRFNSILF